MEFIDADCILVCLDTVPGYILAKKISKRKNLLPESLTGMVIFYAVIIFLIYDYNNTDYFKALLISCAINLVLIPLLSFTTRREEHTA